MVQQMWKLLTLLVIISNSQGLKRTWEYTILAINQNTSNVDIFDSNMQVARDKRNNYGLSGTIQLKQDVTDDYSVYSETYHSKSGVGDYFKLPYGFPKQTASGFMRTSFRNIVYDSISNCSNVPKIEEHFKGPVLKGDYVFNKCLVNVDKLPPYMKKGYYKIIVAVVGVEQCFFEILIEVEER